MDQSIKVTDNHHEQQQQQQDPTEEELHRLLLPDVCDLPLTPPSAIQSNFVSYFAPGSTFCVDLIPTKFTKSRAKINYHIVYSLNPKPCL